ncbi:MAG: hypothetical protein WD066_05090 [Planctomycetaceae bacterium]
MKGVPGLVIAAALGIAGAVVNWLYMASMSQGLASVEFIAIADGVAINPEETFRLEHFQKVEIPSAYVDRGNLASVAVKWNERHNLDGMTATRALSEGELLLQQDRIVRGSRSFSELVGADERYRTIAIDPGSIVPARMNPRDRIMFVVPRPGAAGGVEEIGPFRILAIGDRTEPHQPARSSGRVGDITIFWNEKNSEEQKAVARLPASGTKGLQIIGLSAAAERDSGRSRAGGQ